MCGPDELSASEIFGASVHFAVLSEVFAGAGALMVLPVVDVVVGVLRVPGWVAHLVFFRKVLLWSPHILAAVWVLFAWEWSLVLWDIDLIFRHEVMQTRVLLVLKPCVGDTQIVIGMHTNGKLTWNGIPRVLVHLPDRRVTVRHLSHFIIGSSRPQYLDLLALRVCHNLTADVSLVGLIEDINAHVYDHVSVVDLFVRGEAELLDTERLTTGQAWHTSHQLLNIRRLHGVVPRGTHLTIQLLYILHGPGAIVCWNGSTLANRVDVSHVVDGRRRVRMERFDVGVNILGGW